MPSARQASSVTPTASPRHSCRSSAVRTAKREDRADGQIDAARDHHDRQREHDQAELAELPPEIGDVRMERSPAGCGRTRSGRRPAPGTESRCRSSAWSGSRRSGDRARSGSDSALGVAVDHDGMRPADWFGRFGSRLMPLNWLELTVTRNRVSKKEPPRRHARGGSVAALLQVVHRPAIARGDVLLGDLGERRMNTLRSPALPLLCSSSRSAGRRCRACSGEL